ncbi:uncharacterized protein LOC125370686 [Ricinus communis]|uniref:uncharacterized protein LOC125370686 n=1 Tax=Ricinus communis TaxID=3988 RepID=UPI00201AB190|nr:uncharacterized protein LOC125370686 [Ricinus communis]
MQHQKKLDLGYLLAQQICSFIVDAQKKMHCCFGLYVTRLAKRLNVLDDSLSELSKIGDMTPLGIRQMITVTRHPHGIEYRLVNTIVREAREAAARGAQDPLAGIPDVRIPNPARVFMSTSGASSSYSVGTSSAQISALADRLDRVCDVQQQHYTQFGQFQEETRAQFGGLNIMLQQLIRGLERQVTQTYLIVEQMRKMMDAGAQNQRLIDDIEFDLAGCFTDPDPPPPPPLATSLLFIFQQIQPMRIHHQQTPSSETKTCATFLFSFFFLFSLLYFILFSYLFCMLSFMLFPFIFPFMLIYFSRTLCFPILK